MASSMNNKFLINAPAGSGKTTYIKSKINEILKDKPNSNILCITYTNRAADELSEDNNSENVQIKTIHSFLNWFMQPYFSHKEIINLYFELYRNEIMERINNENDKENWAKLNQQYKDEYGGISYNIIKDNINCIKYNELNYNTYYSGGLSHDNLLLFSKKAMDKFEIIKYRIAKKHDYIFIDEYQDTTTEVLYFFYKVAQDENINLFLLGDRMQQIYRNYDGNFEEELMEFNTSIQMETNYRSSKSIVDVLNNIYNDEDFEQKPDEIEKEGMKPEVYITKNINKKVNEEDLKYPEAVKLYVKNRKRFEEIEAINLYFKVNNMEKYSYNKKYDAVDVLTDYSKDNPDDLFKLLFCISKMYYKYKENIYGFVIQEFKNNNIFNNKIFNITSHSDKEFIKKTFENLFDFFTHPQDNSIKDLITFLDYEQIIDKKLSNQILNNEEYTDVINIDMKELLNLINYLEGEITASTQHGVKGEGYETIFFICDEEYRINIKIYDFFEMWSKIDIDLTSFQDFYYSYAKDIRKIKSLVNPNIKFSDFNKQILDNHIDKIITNMNDMINKYHDNKYFNYLYLDIFNNFLENHYLKDFRKIKINKTYRILNSYRIFYVGCSRAKKRLLVFIDKNKVETFQEKLINKLDNIGFEIFLE